MEADVGKMEAQIEVWGAKINGLAAAAAKAGVGARIDLHLHIDDLKVKRAVALAKFDEFKTAEAAKRASLKTGLEHAWSELEAAFRDPRR